MASMMRLKRRIRSAQNISKTTRALNMIATSKLKRAQEAAVATRPYADKLREVVASIAKNVEPGEKISYLRENSSNKDIYIVISPDKGLAGSMIPTLVREFIKQTKDANADIITVGKKIEPHVQRSKKTLLASFPAGNSLPEFSAVYPIVSIIHEAFLKGNAKRVYVLFTAFKSVFTQIPAVTQLLPVALPLQEKVTESGAIELFEPSAEEILPELLKRYLQIAVYHALLESYASFQAAQMTAMKNATDNAKQIIEDLKLLYNKTRQEKITNELLDISGSMFAQAD